MGTRSTICGKRPVATAELKMIDSFRSGKNSNRPKLRGGQPLGNRLRRQQCHSTVGSGEKSVLNSRNRIPSCQIKRFKDGALARSICAIEQIEITERDAFPAQTAITFDGKFRQFHSSNSFAGYAVKQLADFIWCIQCRFAQSWPRRGAPVVHPMTTPPLADFCFDPALKQNSRR